MPTLDESTVPTNPLPPVTHQGWIGVDLDGTLAEYHGWVGECEIGVPIAPMVERVKAWLNAGFEVRIFTARVTDGDNRTSLLAIRAAIEAWCQKHIGAVLPITNVKDYGMIELWDDRAVQVILNTGRRADEKEWLHKWNHAERSISTLS